MDEAARPKAPDIGAGKTPAGQAGRHLAAIHRHHLMEMAKARQVLHFVETGAAEPKQLADALANMSLTENMQVFGTLCGQECQMLGFHHNAEEHHMFPDLEGKQIDGLSAVVAKLRLEHLVVHELLDRLGKAAAKLVENPSDANMKTCAEVFEKLDAVIRSHFSYEETELRDALDYWVTSI